MSSLRSDNQKHVTRIVIAAVAMVLVVTATYSIVARSISPEGVSLPQSGTHFVFAPTTPLHAEPAPDSEIIGTLTYGTPVTALGTQNRVEGIRGKTGGWAHIKTGDRTGYAMSTVVLPVPPPDLLVAGLLSYTEGLTPVGMTDETREPGLITRLTPYAYGLTLEERELEFEYGTFTEHQLLVTGLTLAQGYALASAIAHSTGPQSFQATSPIAPDKQADGTRRLFDDRNWQIIVVTETQAGLIISFPERAD